MTTDLVSTDTPNDAYSWWSAWFGGGGSEDNSLPPVFRGGSDLTPKPGEIKIDPKTGLLKTTHGVSTFDNPGRVENFGGAYEVIELPEGLKIEQRGKGPTHYEIMPARPMTLEEYAGLLKQVKLRPVGGK